MAFPRIGGAGINFNFAAQGTNAITLPAGTEYTPPDGTYALVLGPYTTLQWLDPATNRYTTVATANRGGNPVIFDQTGGNYRISNLTGCVVGAIVTSGGSGLTNGIGQSATGLTVTSTGGTVWVPVVGGALNTSATVTGTGSNYTYPPTMIIPAPPPGGVQATGFITLSGGVISTATFTNQGAGYGAVPTIALQNDPRDTTGTGGAITIPALTTSGVLTALYPSDPGNPVTTLPTITFSPATCGATPIMNWTVTGFAIVSAGSAAFSTAAPFLIETQNGIQTTAAAANTAGPINSTGLTTPRQAQIAVAASGTAFATAGQQIIDAGFGFQVVPNLIITVGGSLNVTNMPTASASVGGTTDTSYIQPI